MEPVLFKGGQDKRAGEVVKRVSLWWYTHTFCELHHSGAAPWMVGLDVRETLKRTKAPHLFFVSLLSINHLFIICETCLKIIPILPWLHSSVDPSVVPCPGRLWVRSPVRAHTSVLGLTPSQDTYLHCGYDPRLGHVWEAIDQYFSHRCFSLSLPPFLSF